MAKRICAYTRGSSMPPEHHRILCLMVVDNTNPPVWISDLHMLRTLKVGVHSRMPGLEFLANMPDIRTVTIDLDHALKTVPEFVSRCRRLQRLQIRSTVLERLPVRLGRLTLLNDIVAETRVQVNDATIPTMIFPPWEVCMKGTTAIKQYLLLHDQPMRSLATAVVASRRLRGQGRLPRELWAMIFFEYFEGE